jgi:hypothetical protein
MNHSARRASAFQAYLPCLRCPKDSYSGIAKAYVDGVFKQEVDLYPGGQQYAAVMYSIDGLANTNHTLTIEAAGRRNPSSSGTHEDE